MIWNTFSSSILPEKAVGLHGIDTVHQQTEFQAEGQVIKLQTLFGLFVASILWVCFT